MSTMPQDAIAAKCVNYFFYKCGEANCWLPLAEDHGLYVGFGDTADNKDANWIGNREPDPNFYTLTGYDDDNIAWLMHPRNRPWFLVITFSQADLIFWEVRGKLKAHAPGSAVFERAAKLWKTFPSVTRKTYSHIFGSEAKRPLFKVLPAKKVACVPRSQLYASIDSLAVYQFLNRGTCRPIWRIDGPTEAEMPELIAEQRQPSIHGGDKNDDEKKYAAFVRLYLNSAVHSSLNSKLASSFPALVGQPTLHSCWPSLSAVDRQKLVLATLNPILVETAALYFCLDLGLVGDIGSGKGIDVIDVRARAESQLKANAAADRLVSLRSFGVGISEQICGRLRSEHVLEIQCKAADRKVNSKDIIYFGYRKTPKSATNTVSLGLLGKALAHEPWNEGLLKRFLKMQQRLVSNTARE